MIIYYNGTDDIEMLVSMCIRLPHLRTLVLFSSHKRFSESVKEISELLEQVCFGYGGVIHAKQSHDTLFAEFENGSSIIVTVARECVRGQRAHVIEYETCIDEEILNCVVRPLVRGYDQALYKEIYTE